MPRTVFTNNARTTLSAGINNSVTSIGVTNGAVFPAPTGGDWAYLTIESGADIEIVKLTARSGNTLTVTRAQDGTTAKTFASGASISLRLNKAALDEIYTELDGKALSTHTHTLSQISDMSAWARTLNDDVDAPAARVTLGLVIGTNVQAYHANLAAFAGLSLIADRLPYANGTGTLTLATLTAAGRALLDDADAPAQRVTLGLGTAAVVNTGTSGAAVPLLNGNNTHSGTTIFSGAVRTTTGISFGADADAYIYASAADSISVRTGASGAYRYFQFNESGTFSPLNGGISTPNGSAGAPSYSFTSDTNTGMFSSAADTLDFVTAGATRLQITNSGVVEIAKGTSTGSAVIQLGTARTASGYAYIDFVGDTTYTDYGLRVMRENTGANARSTILHRGTGNFDITAVDAASVRIGTSSTSRFVIYSGGNAEFTNALTIGGVTSFAGGSAAAPGLTFTGDTNTGMYRLAADTLGFATGGVERFYIDSSGVTQYLGAIKLNTGNPLIFDTAAGTQRLAIYRTAGAQRWAVGIDGSAESGSDAGSNFVFYTYNDAGSFLTTALSISRSNNTATFAGGIRSAAGSAASPAFSFSADTNTGFYSGGADIMALSVGGTNRWNWNTAAMFSGAGTGSAAMAYNIGTAAAPSFYFVSDSDTGMYRVGADQLGFSVGGTLRLDISSTKLTSAVPGQMAIAVSSETTGALTSASRNLIVRCAGNITLPASGMSDGDVILIDPRGTARTVTRPGSHTMYVNNADVATGTTGAHNIVTAMFHSSSKWTLQGSVT
jgi:hypothetical protein